MCDYLYTIISYADTRYVQGYIIFDSYVVSFKYL